MKAAASSFSTTSNTMGGLLSKSANHQSAFTASSAHRFDGLGIGPRPEGLPLPTAQSHAKLQQLLRANHQFYATFFNKRKFHNHIPHGLTSAYFLGATPETLTMMYEKTTTVLDKWEEDSPAEVTDDDWFLLLGKKPYERGFQDYFQEKVTDSLSFNWRTIVKEFLVTSEPENSDKMMTSLFGGLLHPLIHLGYAEEIDDWEVATEAMTLCALSYANKNFDKLTLDPFKHKKSTQAKRPIDILLAIRDDPTFDGQFSVPSEGVTGELVLEHHKKLSEYLNQFHVGETHEEIIANLKELLATTATLFLSSHKDNGQVPDYDFFLVHLLTGTQATIELIDSPADGSKKSMFPVDYEYRMVQSLWTIILTIYIIQSRPSIKVDRITHPQYKGALPTGLEKFADIKDYNDRVWASTYEILFPVDGSTTYEEHCIKAVRALLFASRYLNKADYGLPETTDAGFELFTQAAHSVAYSLHDNVLIGRPNDKRTLDIKP